MSGLLGEFHAFVNGGAGRDAIEMQQLKCSQAQRDEHFRFELCVGTLEKRAQRLIEFDLPTQHAEYQSSGKISILRGECRDGLSTK